MKLLFKFLIFRFTPHMLFDYVAYLCSKIDKRLLSCIGGKGNIFVFGGCDYSNLGDYAITLAQVKLLKSIFPNKCVHIVRMNDTYKGIKTLLRNRNHTDLVTIIGGGNMGELYYGYERKRNFIVRKLHNYRIVSFPQSMIWSDNRLAKLGLKRSNYVYSHHNGLLLLAREELSFAKMKSNYPKCDIKLCPDVVFTLDERMNLQRKGIVLSIRADKESIMTEADKELLKQKLDETHIGITALDTCDSNGLKLDTAFSRLIRIYNEASVVITDRLHGMIFSYITGTPAIVLPNNNGKIEYSYHWIAYSGYIKLISKDEIPHLHEHINEMLTVTVNSNRFMKKRLEFIERFKSVILS